MADLPYTYTHTDRDDQHLSIGPDYVIDEGDSVTIRIGDASHSIPVADAARMARAVLAAAGDTGHLVVSEDDRDESRRYIRILEAQRDDLRREVRNTSDRMAAVEQRLAASRVSEGDMVEPGDEVPALAELYSRVTRIEEHLGITESA